MAGPLKNARHERFAQERAKGKSQDKAYSAAGYKPDRGAASRLSANVSVALRIEELKAAAAEKTIVTVASLTRRLLDIAEMGERKAEAPMLSVARAALMDVAKLNGLVIDKTQRELSEDQMKLLLAEIAATPGTAEKLLTQLTFNR